MNMKVAPSPSIASRIELAFQSASTTTGADFGYLVKTAERESNFNVSAKAPTSSATGLFQFIESTWLETMKQSGAQHGLGDYAKDITRSANGKYRVSDPARRREILDLRKDPEIASVMAGELTAKNGAYLENRLGREPTNGELYIAHFLGANGASRLIGMAEGNPDARADTVFSRQAKANRSIFYEKSGHARSASEVYDKLVRQHDAPAQTRYAAVIPAGEDVPMPVAKATVSDALQPVAVAAADILQAVSSDTGTVSPLAIASVVASSVMAAKSADEDDKTTFPAARAEPLGGFAFLSQSVAGLQDRLTAMHADAGAEDPGETPVDPADTVVASAAPASNAADAVADDANAGLRPAPNSDAAVLLAAEDPNQFARLSTTAVPVSSSQASASAEPRDRVASAWRATAPSSAFQALFRNDASASRGPINPSYLNAFAAQPDAGRSPLFAGRQAGETDERAAVDAAAPVAIARVAANDESERHGPLNLIGALRYQIFKEPEDLLPPV
ncbi:hypothetical protein D1F64_14960 [Breoghania sp. L-A4]|nr:hypothetical protein D1F64_14960 [Breoghania sp. L-A4]